MFATTPTNLPFSLSRRHMLARVGGTFGAVAMDALGRLEAAKTSPMAAKPPGTRGRAKSVIFLHMVGGPSQMDTFDYKPLLQKLNGKPVPQSYRDAVANSAFKQLFVDCTDLMGSPYQFRQYGESGMWVSELFPHLAERVDKMCFIHSMQAESNNHAPACYQMHTGDTVAGKPSLGSWVTYGLGSENQSLPGYVTLFEVGPLGGAANYSNAFLPAAYQPTHLRSHGQIVDHLVPPAGAEKTQGKVLDLIRGLDAVHLAKHPGVDELEARIASYELAYKMQSAAMEVGNLDAEPASTQKAYGIDSTDEHQSKFARKCMLACRLVERGVRFVQVYHMHDGGGWDAHNDLPANHPPLARQCDQPIAALLDDLEERGLLEETLVVWAGEFGRTPMMQGTNGRQHNSASFTIWMAGGGVKPGRIGSSDELGLLTAEHPYQFRHLHTTILAALGLDADELTFPHNGIAERLTGIPGAARLIPGVLG